MGSSSASWWWRPRRSRRTAHPRFLRVLPDETYPLEANQFPGRIFLTILLQCRYRNVRGAFLIYGEKTTFCRDSHRSRTKFGPGRSRLRGLGAGLERDPNRLCFRCDNAVCRPSLTTSPEAGTLWELITLRRGFAGFLHRSCAVSRYPSRTLS